jgi:putative nucleotidyltransferase with HDIG domain
MSHNGELFQELHSRAHEYLKKGWDIIIDATNISQKRRISLVKDYKDFKRVCILLEVPYNLCLVRDYRRERRVGEKVLKDTYLKFQISAYFEGWDDIMVYPKREVTEHMEYVTRNLEEFLNEEHSFEELFYYLSDYKIFNDIENLSHDSTYHHLSVGRHTYHAFKYVKEHYDGEDKKALMWAALLHDIGKKFTKNFKDGSMYANFICHENVSAYLALEFLRSLAYDDSFCLYVSSLVNLHMRLPWDAEYGTVDRNLLDMVGNDMYERLVFLREADESAK